MRGLVRYATAGLIVFGAGLMFSNPTARDAEAVPFASGASLPAPEGPAPAAAAAKDARLIADVLAAHGNAHDIQPSFFVDLVRSLEKSGFARDAAYEVAVALARNPKLDTIAGLTVAGSLQAYMAETGEALNPALAELANYVEQPDANAGRVGERFGILQPETEALIGDKIRGGNAVAAQRLMQEALLRRFNPSLAAKIFVPRSGPAACCESVSPAPIRASVVRADPPRAEPSRAEQRRRPPSRHRVLSSSSKRSPPSARRPATARRH